MRLDLNGFRRAVIVAPHPDDEIIRAAGLIDALRRRGRGLGRRGQRRCRLASRQPDMARRASDRRARAESRHALRRLGVGSDRVTFLGLPDGGLMAEDGDPCRKRLHRALRKHRGMDLLVGPAATDAHPDHRAVATARPFSLRRAASDLSGLAAAEAAGGAEPDRLDPRRRGGEAR
jgi:LmbE family N-acetylglucosaminyl deacetylase